RRLNSGTRGGIARFSMQQFVPATSPHAATPIGPSAHQGGMRWRDVAHTAFPFLVVGLMWEAVAHGGLFPPRLFPPLEMVFAALVRLTASGILLHHAAETLLRLMAGFALAALVGVAIGIAMGRSRRAEDILLPLVSIGAPI